MRKFLIAIALMTVLMCAFACAENSYVECMRVVNCDEWVSLREYADTKSDRVAEVPLGATVDNCWERGDFYYCEYRGTGGYILSKYLKAESEIREAGLGDLRVVNCDEWVSLRARPDTDSERIAKVPLGEVVSECSQSGDFVRCTYNGISGYIVSKYLDPAGAAQAPSVGSVSFEGGSADIAANTGKASEGELFDAEQLGEVEGMEVQLLSLDEIIASGKTVLDRQIGQYRVVASRGTINGHEIMKVGCFDKSDRTVWSHVTEAEYDLMLTVTEAYIAGTEEDPLVMVFNGQKTGTVSGSNASGSSSITPPLGGKVHSNWGNYNQQSWATRRKDNPSHGRLYHLGVDLYSDDKDMLAVADGRIGAAGKNGGEKSGNGYYVLIEHRMVNKETGEEKVIYSFYGHMVDEETHRQICKDLAEGREITVHQGDKIGVMGNTGNSRGEHVHLAFVDTPLKDGSYLGYERPDQFGIEPVEEYGRLVIKTDEVNAENGCTYYNPWDFIDATKMDPPIIGMDEDYAPVWEAIPYESIQPGMLTAFDLSTGRVVWALSSDECPVTSGLCSAAAEDGTQYIAGYFGPDPVCISNEGEILWQSQVNDSDVYWPYEIEVKGNTINVKYYSYTVYDWGYYLVSFDAGSGRVLGIDTVKTSAP